MKGAVRNGTLRVCLIPAGCYAVEIVTHMVAVSMTNVAYMIAVKRLSLLLGVLYGRFMFGEKSLGERLFGGTLMVAGVALIACGGT